MALTQALKDAPDVELFGRETFYPFDYWEIPFAAPEALQEVKDEAYAIHHWHATWQTREELMRRTRELMLRTRQNKRRERNLRNRQEQLQRKLARRDDKLRNLEARLERIETSRWWRLGQRLGRLRRAPGALGGRGRDRGGGDERST